MRNGPCINSFFAFELASLLLEVVFGPTPLSWGLLRSREGAFEGQPADEQAGVGTLFQRGLVALGCGRRSWRATVSFVCALMCAAQSSLVLIIQLGWNGPPWASAGMRASTGTRASISRFWLAFTFSFFHSSCTSGETLWKLYLLVHFWVIRGLFAYTHSLLPHQCTPL